MLQRFDKNGDGELDEFERKTAKLAKKQKSNERKEQVVERFDEDGDGQLSDAEKDEAKAAREAMIAQYDTDGDGRRSLVERKIMLEAKRNSASE